MPFTKHEQVLRIEINGFYSKLSKSRDFKTHLSEGEKISHPPLSGFKIEQRSSCWLKGSRFSHYP